MAAAVPSVFQKPNPRRMPWEPPPAPPLPKGGTKQDMKNYYAEREAANKAHSMTPDVQAHGALVRRNDDIDPAARIHICELYVLARLDDPLFLTKHFSVLIFTHRAMSFPYWTQFYSKQSEIDRVRRSLTHCAKTAVLSLRMGGIVLEEYFGPKTIQWFDSLI
jgi:hypothetical protein